MALRNGGSNRIANLQVLCIKCNQEKASSEDRNFSGKKQYEELRSLKLKCESCGKVIEGLTRGQAEHLILLGSPRSGVPYRKMPNKQAWESGNCPRHPIHKLVPKPPKTFLVFAQSPNDQGPLKVADHEPLIAIS